MQNILNETSGVNFLPYGNQGLVVWKKNQLAGFHMIDTGEVKSFPSFGLM